MSYYTNRPQKECKLLRISKLYDFDRIVNEHLAQGFEVKNIHIPPYDRIYNTIQEVFVYLEREV